MKVQKRDGQLVDFDIKKIALAIQKAFNSLKMDTDSSVIELLALKVTSDFQSKIHGESIHVEDIQDSVEKVLSESGYYKVAKAYILYRKQRENVRQITNTANEYTNIVNSYLKSTNNDRNQTLEYFSVGGLILSNSGAITQNYWLKEVYDEQISQAHENGDIYLHDLDMLTGDSAGWSLPQFLLKGLGGVKENINSRPAKHLFSLVNQLVNFFGIMQNEWAGAQTLSGFDTYLAPFIKVDVLDQEAINRCIETFIYGVNIPSRWGTSTPFTNIVFDWNVPADLKDKPCIVGGEYQDFVYGDCQKEMEMIQEAYLKVMLESDGTGRGFQFPIPTVFINSDFDFEKNDLLFKLASKYGTPYFANHVSLGQLRNENMQDYSVLYNRTGGLFAYGENTGSIGTVTINMPRIAYLSKDEDDFFHRLEYLMNVSARSLHVKRQVLDKFLKAGLYPYTAQYISNFDSHFSTIGLIGMNEVGLNASWLKASLLEEKTQDFCIQVLNYMKEKLISYQKEYHEYFNLVATPAENVTHRYAKKDKELYPEIVVNSYYTNSATLPVNATEDVFEALDIESKFQSLYTGGTVFDVYLEKCLYDWKATKNLVKSICENYDIPYFTISPTYSVCPEHGYIAGKVTECPHCQKKTKIFARVSGYYHGFDGWNEAKKQEFEQRKEYDVF